MDLRETIARALCKLEGGNPDFCTSWYSDRLAWADYVADADAVLSALIPELAELRELSEKAGGAPIFGERDPARFAGSCMRFVRSLLSRINTTENGR